MVCSFPGGPVTISPTSVLLACSLSWSLSWSQRVRRVESVRACRLLYTYTSESTGRSAPPALVICPNVGLDTPQLLTVPARTELLVDNSYFLPSSVPFLTSSFLPPSLLLSSPLPSSPLPSP